MIIVRPAPRACIPEKELSFLISVAKERVHGRGNLVQGSKGPRMSQAGVVGVGRFRKTECSRELFTTLPGDPL
jgi:hypothetical protein